MPPTKQAVPPFLNFAPLENGSRAYDTRRPTLQVRRLRKVSTRRGAAWDLASLKDINSQLLQTERTFTDDRRIEGTAVVQTPDLRSRSLHRLWREDDSRGARNDGRTQWNDADDGSAIVGAILMHEASLVDAIAQQLEQAVGAPATAQPPSGESAPGQR